MRGLAKVTVFDPDFLVVCLGLDTARHDPTGTWSLTPKDFFRNGEMIGETGLPLLVVQEGGYNTRNLGNNARHFFEGLADAVFTPTRGSTLSFTPPKGMQFRYDPVPADVEAIRNLVTATGFFREDEPTRPSSQGSTVHKGYSPGRHLKIPLSAAGSSPWCRRRNGG